MGKCEFCNYDVEIDNSTKIIKCPSCGHYKFNLDENISSLDSNQKLLVSHWIRMHQDNNSLNINNKTIDYILNQPPPTHREIANNIILAYGKEANTFMEPILFHPGKKLAVSGCQTKEDFDYFTKHLEEEKFLGKTSHNHNYFLTFKGWEKFDELNSPRNDSKKVFMAMKYDEQLFNIVENKFKPAISETGFNLYVLRDLLKPGVIDNQLRAEIKSSKFLIADLTHANNGAYWEAGYAEGLGKKVIYTCEDKKFKNSHFDTNHCTTIIWSINNIDLGMQQLKSTIRIEFPEAQ